MVDLLNFRINHDLDGDPLRTIFGDPNHNEAPMEPSQRAELEARQLRERWRKRVTLW
jgi:hypothetical protein